MTTVLNRSAPARLCRTVGSNLSLSWRLRVLAHAKHVPLSKLASATSRDRWRGGYLMLTGIRTMYVDDLLLAADALNMRASDVMELIDHPTRRRMQGA